MRGDPRARLGNRGLDALQIDEALKVWRHVTNARCEMQNVE
jgi:hypothetical protein